MNRLAGLVLAGTACMGFSGALAGCSSHQLAGNTIAVSSGEATCNLNRGTANAGQITLTVTNVGTSSAKFYVYETHHKEIVSAVTAIAPAATRDINATLDPGDYTSVCDRGNAGDGGVAHFRVLDAGLATGQHRGPDVHQNAVKKYQAYLRAQMQTLVDRTQVFTTAYATGDPEAKALYLLARATYATVEPVAGSFGNIDAELNARSDQVEPGQAWTGWHRIEQDLWLPARPPITPVERAVLIDQLLNDTRSLQVLINGKMDLTTGQIASGATDLLDDLATTGLTGEEERYSHADLVDLAGNATGVHAAVQALEPIVARSDTALVRDIQFELDRLTATLLRYAGRGGGKQYSKLTKGQVTELGAQLDALIDPMTRLTAAASK